MLFSYVLLQLTFWWFFHATVMLWKLQFPFHARTFEHSGRMKYIHIACIVSGLLIPMVSIVASMADFAVNLQSNNFLQSRNISFISGGLGYGLIRSPPILCSATDRNTLYYSNLFPVNVIVIIGMTELIFVFRIIHKVSSYNHNSLIPDLCTEYIMCSNYIMCSKSLTKKSWPNYYEGLIPMYNDPTINQNVTMTLMTLYHTIMTLWRLSHTFFFLCTHFSNMDCSRQRIQRIPSG